MDSYQVSNNIFDEKPWNKTPGFYNNPGNNPYIANINSGNGIGSTVIPVSKFIKQRTNNINSLIIYHGLNANFFELKARVWDIATNKYYPIPYTKTDGGGGLGASHNISLLYDNKKITFTEFNTLFNDYIEVQLYFLKFYV